MTYRRQSEKTARHFCYVSAGLLCALGIVLCSLDMGDSPDFSNLVGQNANNVKDSLLRDYPGVVALVQIMTPDMPITEDYSPTRLRLFVDGNGVINEVPVLG